jgi:hypothetical protein
MLVEEAQWIGNILARYECTQISPMLNMGSGTRYFRMVVQPHIDKHIFDALSKRRVDVVHCDIKMEDGVDIEGDMFDSDCQRRLAGHNFKCALLSNLLEHLHPEHRDKVCPILCEIMDKQSLLIITVPFSYPYHPDPIDTMFRPRPNEVAQMFPNFEMVSSAIIAGNTYLQDLLRMPAHKVVKSVLRIFAPFYKFDHWLGCMHNFLWLYRPYSVSCVLLARVN